MRPIGDRVIVRRVAETETQKNGIFIPEQSQEKPLEGEVVAIGKKVEEISVGERILFGKYSGTEVKINGDEFLILRTEEILTALDQPKKGKK